jgi:prepilin signal peptidase PulO-like enzyme (type II secretory pathway)
MPVAEPLHLAVFAWLLICAIQDWRSRAIGNWLTLPPLALTFCLRSAGLIQVSLLPLLVAIAFLLVFWQRSWIGGADAKASLALALLDIQVFAWPGWDWGCGTLGCACVMAGNSTAGCRHLWVSQPEPARCRL